jgi:hypothetical protein
MTLGKSIVKRITKVKKDSYAVAQKPQKTTVIKTGSKASSKATAPRRKRIKI